MSSSIPTFKQVSRAVNNKYRQFMSLLESSEDPDRLLSYYTRQQVKLLDRNLGIVYYSTLFCIGAWILGYMFIYSKGYLELEQAKGGVVIHAFGDALGISTGKSASRYFSTEELTQPGLENGNIFVATRQEVVRQQRGVCADPDTKCARNADCTRGGNGYCDVEAGVCVESSWCNMDAETEVYEMQTDTMQIWTRSTIQFVKLASDKVFSTEMDSAIPRSGYNAFTVRELLMLAEPLPVRFEEVAELGAAIEVQFFWDCNVKADKCDPTVKVRRVDTIFDPDNIGFSFSFPEYVDDDHRVRNNVRGIRIFFRTAGVGKKVSVSATITKASMGAALFSIAQIICDLLLSKAFKLRNKYMARKFVNTPDFSDYMKHVEDKKKHQIKDEELILKEEQKIIDEEQKWLATLHEESEHV